jgi:hypothetical protein
VSEPCSREAHYGGDLSLPIEPWWLDSARQFQMRAKEKRPRRWLAARFECGSRGKATCNFANLNFGQLPANRSCQTD